MKTTLFTMAAMLLSTPAAASIMQADLTYEGETVQAPIEVIGMYDQWSFRIFSMELDSEPPWAVTKGLYVGKVVPVVSHNFYDDSGVYYRAQFTLTDTTFTLELLDPLTVDVGYGLLPYHFVLADAQLSATSIPESCTWVLGMAAIFCCGLSRFSLLRISP